MGEISATALNTAHYSAGEQAQVSLQKRWSKMEVDLKFIGTDFAVI